MWFIFPQLKGARPQRRRRCATASARASKRWPTSRTRCSARAWLSAHELILAVSGKSALEILGTPDDLKFCSSMTLFSTLAEPGSCFAEALDRYCEDGPDATTLALLDRS